MGDFDDSVIGEIRTALEAELEVSSKPVVFTVEGAAQVADLWQITIKADDTSGGGLDEALEGNTAWWGEPRRGTANVLSVAPEELLLNLRFATAVPPSPGQPIFIYPPRYLEQLLAAWNDPSWAAKCASWLQSFQSEGTFDTASETSSRLFGHLRSGQRSAFTLTGWRTGLLWGPPGTGKTFTLGALLASYLVDRPSDRVLLLSSTNSAVDQALLAVDRALEHLVSIHPEAATARRRCTRIGSNFQAAAYTNREHLLPGSDGALLKSLTALEAQRPDSTNAVAYGQWKRQSERLKQQIRQIATDAMVTARLAALTTTSAAFRLSDLRSLSTYDLVVFDEGSQVGLAHAACIAPLARRCIVAGDPQQLSPIVQSPTQEAQRWLGRTLFDLKDLRGRETCRLDEQSRMADTICRVVGGTFYGGNLRVAADCAASRGWLEERAIGALDPVGGSAAARLPVESAAAYSRKWGGWIRFESAQAIVRLAQQLAAVHGEQAILVLTPFRAQRALIKTMLRGSGLRWVQVLTVHRAQGGERHTVIFDPVDGNGKFVRAHDRLLNVAISRAQARLVFAASQSDMQNPTIRRLIDLMCLSGGQHAAADTAPQLRTEASMPGFPASHIGKIIGIGKRYGRLEYIDDTSIILTDARTGQHVTFKTTIALPGYRGPASGTRPTAFISTKDWEDYGGRGEAGYRRAGDELVRRVQRMRHETEEVKDALSRLSPPVGSVNEQPTADRWQGLQPPKLSPAVKRAMKIASGTPMTGTVVECESNGGGVIRSANGERYQFGFGDLSPSLKIKGVQSGQHVTFCAIKGRVWRATVIS